MPREKDYDKMMENWPYEYYKERDAIERKKLLDAAMERGIDPEGDKIRKMLWEMRYIFSEKTGELIQDNYLKAWMDFRFAVGKTNSFFQGKRIVKEAKDDLEAMGFEAVKEYGELGQKVLYDELYHLVNLYIQLCSEDRNYGSIILGLGKMNKESYVAKVAKEVHEVTSRMPKNLGMEEYCALLKKAGQEAFYDAFPNFEQYLDELDK